MVVIGLYKGITGIFPRIDLFSKNARMQDFPPPLVFALLETKSLRIEWYGGFSKSISLPILPIAFTLL